MVLVAVAGVKRKRKMVNDDGTVVMASSSDSLRTCDLDFPEAERASGLVRPASPPGPGRQTPLPVGRRRRGPRPGPGTELELLAAVEKPCLLEDPPLPEHQAAASSAIEQQHQALSAREAVEAFLAQ